MASKWLRPADLSVPQVWARFPGPRPMPDGRVPSFWVQDVREEDEDAVLDIMKDNFLRKETLAAYLKMADDPEVVAESVNLWKDVMKQRLSIALWTDYPDRKPRIVGCNLLAVSGKDDPKFEATTSSLKKIVELMELLENLARIHDRYGVDKFLTGFGLSIIEEFRGMGLGVEILKARVPLCQAMGLEVTATLFSSVASQKQSARAGFHQVAEVPYAEFKDNGQVVFNVTQPPSAQEKALIIPPKS